VLKQLAVETHRGKHDFQQPVETSYTKLKGVVMLVRKADFAIA
jgi:hypothetical protein